MTQLSLSTCNMGDSSSQETTVTWVFVLQLVEKVLMRYSFAFNWDPTVVVYIL